MLRRFAPYLGLVVGLALGATLSYVQRSDASRNSSGTYSLPSGNPVVSGTTITSANENAFRADVSTEITNSVDRNGRGAMLAPLQCTNGTAGAPSLTFASDTDTGVYRVAANTLGLAAGGSGVVAISSGGAAITGTHTVSGVASFADGSAATPGISFSSDSNSGLYRIGADNIGASVNGAKVLDVSTSGLAVTGTLSSTGTFTAGSFTAAGNIPFTGSDPAATTGFSSTQTPMNLVKAWALVSTATPTLTAGFNVASVGDSGANNIAVNFETDFDSTTYGCIVQGVSTAGTNVHQQFSYVATSAGTATVQASADFTNASPVDLSDTASFFFILCFGAN